MKRLIIITFCLAALATQVCAANVDILALKRYVEKSFQKCPGGKLELLPVQDPGPRGFVIYSAKQTSSDTTCGRQAYVMFSPVTQQVVIGTVFQLPTDPRPIEARVSDTASKLLKLPIAATVGGFPLPDGLRAASMNKETEYGPFAYHGFVDGSGSFLIVGTRGTISVDPGRTLLDSLGIENAVRRGNRKAKVEIIELSDFQCPTCGRAHKKVEPMIAANLSKIDYARLDLPLFEHHEWSMFAALGARAVQKVAPKEYWNYVNFIFANQDKITKETVDKTIQNFCDDHDINWKAVEKLCHSPEQKKLMLDQVARAFDNAVVSTPTYIINGQMMGYGPEGTYTIEQIKKAIASAK